MVGSTLPVMCGRVAAVASAPVAVAGIGAVAAVAGPSGPVFAVLTHLLVMAWISVVVAVRRPELTARWFVVRGWEERAWRRAGVGHFRAALRIVGWERVITAQRRFDGTRAGLVELARQTRVSELCHLVVAAVGAGVGVVAAVCGDAAAVLWSGAAVVSFHLYPVLLQRAVRARITRLMTVKSN